MFGIYKRINNNTLKVQIYYTVSKKVMIIALSAHIALMQGRTSIFKYWVKLLRELEVLEYIAKGLGGMFHRKILQKMVQFGAFWSVF